MEQCVAFSTNTTSWQVLATDNTGYDTIALLLAAGKTVFPSLEPGQKASHLVAVSRATGVDTLGAAFRFRTSVDSAPTLGLLVLSGVTYSFPGFSQTDRIAIDSVWVKKSTGTDVLEIAVIY